MHFVQRIILPRAPGRTQPLTPKRTPILRERTAYGLAGGLPATPIEDLNTFSCRVYLGMKAILARLVDGLASSRNVIRLSLDNPPFPSPVAIQRQHWVTIDLSDSSIEAQPTFARKFLSFQQGARPSAWPAFIRSARGVTTLRPFDWKT